MSTRPASRPTPEPAPLRPYQRSAVDELGALTESGHRRATCVLPCGTGKTLVALTAVTEHPHVVVLVPTVALLEQTIAAWTTRDPERAAMAVCSPRSTTPREAGDGDDDDVDVAALSFATTTDPDEVRQHRRDHPRTVTVCTYASAGIAATAAPPGGWDAAVIDEAHRTAGAADKAWGLALDHERFPAQRRYFFTATPRHYEPSEHALDDTGDPAPTASMSNPALYGPIHQPMSLRQAIAGGWLSDYRVALVAVTGDETRAATRGLTVTAAGEPVDLRVAAAQVALARYAATHPGLSTALVFTNRVAHSQEWTRTWGAVTHALPVEHRPRGSTRSTHVDGTMSAVERAAALDTLRGVSAGDLRLVSNCRVLAEGVDLPALDAVVFAEPRTSQPDIVQIVGRALRPHPSGPDRKALIVVPVLVDHDQYGDAVETPVAASGYLPVWQVLTALAHEDSALYRSLVQARADVDTGRATPLEALSAVDQIDADLARFPLDVAERLSLRVLRSTTSTWSTLLARMSEHVRAGGDPDPRAGFHTRDGYPLGQRVRSARASYAAGTLHPTLARMFTDEVPGWRWEAAPARAQVRGFDDYLAALRGHVAATGVPLVRPYEATTVGGQRVAVGAWVDRQRRNARLTPDQVAALAAVLGPNWRTRP